MKEEIGLDLASVADTLKSSLPTRINVDPERMEQDLARLVLGLVEFLRQVLELRAIQRLENGRLTPEEEERLGMTLMRAEQAIHDLAAKFDLSPEDLSLDLGPLGKTI